MSYAGARSPAWRGLVALAVMAVAAALALALVFLRPAVPAPPEPFVYESYDTPLLATSRTAVCPAILAAYCESIGNDVGAGDLDGDGALELVAVGWSWGEVLTVWRYDEQRAMFELLAEGRNSNVSWEAVAVALGDLDGDGRGEIVTGGRGSESGGDAAYVSVWQWDGVSGLTRVAHERWNYGLDTYLRDLIIADFDADGELEVLTVGYVGPAGEVSVWNYSSQMKSLIREGRFTIESPGGTSSFLAVSLIPTVPVPRVLAVATGALFLLELTDGSLEIVDSLTDANVSNRVTSQAASVGDHFRVMVGGAAINTTRPERPEQIVVQEVLVNATHIEFGHKLQYGFPSSAKGFARLTGIALSEDGQVAAVTGASANLTHFDTSVLQLFQVGAAGMVPYALNEWITYVPGSTTTEVHAVATADVSPGRPGPEILTVGRFSPWLEIRLWGSTS